MTAPPEIGNRLLTDIVDYYAATKPKDIFIEYPKSSTLEEWVMIDYATFKKAVDRMSWWLDDLFKSGQSDTRAVCYIARSDFRYFVAMIAAIRSNCKEHCGIRSSGCLISSN
jgi:hypothetical protein